MKQRGFTLLELLVVMALLSLLMAGLVSAMRTMAQTEVRIDQSFQRLDNLRIVHAFLSQTLTRVSSVKTEVAGATGKTTIPFLATSDSVAWVGSLPARPNVGGRHHFRLAVEALDSGPALVLRLLPCGPELTPPDWATAEAKVLVQDVSQLVVQAQGLPMGGQEGGAPWPLGWQAGWPVVGVLPEQVRLTVLDAAQTVMVSWTFALHAFAQSDASIGGVTVGGGVR